MARFGVIDKHGRLRGLTDDDHTQYLNTARHDLQARHPYTVLPDNLAEQAASYIIFKEDSTYKAKNGHTGAIDYSGTDASTVIQACLTSITGGKIFFKNGTYELHLLSAPPGAFGPTRSNLTIEGESFGGVIFTMDGLGGYIYANDVAASHVTFRNLVFDLTANSLTSHESIFNPGWTPAITDLTLENIEFLNCYGTPFVMQGRNNSRVTLKNVKITKHLTSSTNADIINFVGTDCLIDGLELVGNTAANCAGLTSVGLYNVEIRRLITSSVLYPISLENWDASPLAGASALFEGVDIHDCDLRGNDRINLGTAGTAAQAANNLYDFKLHHNTYYSPLGILYVKGGSAVSIDHNVLLNSALSLSGISATFPLTYVNVVGNIIKDAYNGLGAAVGIDYVVTDVTLRNKIINPPSSGVYVFTSTANQARILLDDDINTYTVFYASPPSATELIIPRKEFISRGTATILSGQTSVAFAHSLAGTPTLVTLGATHAEVSDAIWSADATNITITVPSAVTANRNISWCAEYKP